MSNKKSNFCSCIYCKKQFSIKGIYSHYHLVHTDVGKARNIISVENSKIISKKVAEEKLEIKIKEYFNNPTLCKYCNKIIEYKSRNNVFCDTSCAAKYNNSLRPQGHPSRILGNESRSLKNTKIKIIKNNSKPSYTKIKQCITCHKWFALVTKRKTCSDSCYTLSMKNAAKNKTTHPCNKATIEYNGIKLGSSYELSVAMSLDENKISWIKPKPLKYTTPEGTIKQYFPDFYLPYYNVYLDPKNDFLINNINPYHGFTDIDKIKWVSEQNNITILVLDKNNLSWTNIKSILCGIRDSNS